MRFHLSLSFLTLTLGLSACGGGSSDAPAAAFVARVHALQAHAEASVRPLALSTIGAKELFDWAEYKYPSLFPKGPQNFSLVHEGVTYTVRAYPGGTYLGLTDDGRVYGLGAFTNGALQSFGRMIDYTAQIQADSCALYPGSCNANEPLGPLNECFRPASQALALGSRFSLAYTHVGTGREGEATGEMKVESLVEQHTPFAGQSAVQTKVNTDFTITQGGQTSTTTIRSKLYAQAAANELILTLGGESDIESRSAQGLYKVSSRQVYQPAYLNSEATLSVGQSLTRRLIADVTTTTVVSGSTLPTTSDTETEHETYVFEGRETVRVQGRSFDTCRYRQSDPTSPGESTLSWLLVGKGIPVRSVSTDADGTVTQELKSGTLNGQPL